jgi:hypothetical protein
MMLSRQTQMPKRSKKQKKRVALLSCPSLPSLRKEVFIRIQFDPSRRPHCSHLSMSD